ncbi:hypothetical protein LTR84_004980 [Exophiala bonariae]|uniref:Fungal N-terminal domain-containing protein n=1 Tax=Exophiala bonariae TaxID=1690606 RepID=A0AAV9NNS6_9EURO|nr:hypothetical protein LTR84_004980 [Exophiala bonariae]
MDPLSITAACAGILSCIGPLVLKIRRVAVGVREARKDMASLDQELSLLAMLMEILKNDCEDPAFEYPTRLRKSFVDVLGHCAGVLGEMAATLGKFASAKLGKRLEWEAQGRDNIRKLKERLNTYSDLIGKHLEFLALLQSREVKYDLSHTLQQVEMLGNDVGFIRRNTAHLPQMQHDLARLSSQLPLFAEMLRSQASRIGTTREEIEDNIILRRFIEDTCSYAETVFDDLTSRASLTPVPSERQVSQPRGMDAFQDRSNSHPRPPQMDVDVLSVLPEDDAQAWATFATYGFEHVPVESFRDDLTRLPGTPHSDQDSKETASSSYSDETLDRSSSDIQESALPSAPNRDCFVDDEDDKQVATSEPDRNRSLDTEEPVFNSVGPIVNTNADDQEDGVSEPSLDNERILTNFEVFSDTGDGCRRGRSPTPRPLPLPTIGNYERENVAPASDTPTTPPSPKNFALPGTAPDPSRLLIAGSSARVIASEPQPLQYVAKPLVQQLKRRPTPARQDLVYDPNSRRFITKAQADLLETPPIPSTHIDVKQTPKQKVTGKPTTARAHRPKSINPPITYRTEYDISPSFSSTKLDQVESNRSSTTSHTSRRFGSSSDGPGTSRTRATSIQDSDDDSEAINSRDFRQLPRKSSFRNSRRGSFSSFRSFSGATVTLRKVPVFELPLLSTAEKASIKTLLMHAPVRITSPDPKKSRRSSWHWRRGSDSNEQNLGKALIWAINDYDVWNRGAKTVPTEKVVQYLIEMGADVNTKAVSNYSYVPGARGKNLVPVLHLATHAGMRAVVEVLLIKGAFFDAKDWMQRTALHLAAENDLSDTIALLHSRGADINAEDHWGHDALRIAAMMGNFETVQVLISAGANVQAAGLIADVSAHQGTARVLRFLLDQGSNPNDQDRSQRTAVYRAAEQTLIENVRVLLDFGADTSTALYLVENRHRWDVRGRRERLDDSRLVAMLKQNG